MCRFQPRSLEPLPPTHTLRGVVEELRAIPDPLAMPSAPKVESGLGEHITFPQIEWPEPLEQAPAIHAPRARTPAARPREVPLVVDMIEPNHGRLTPWVFWVLVALAFAAVLLESLG